VEFDTSPAAYYPLGLWYRLGESLGLRDLHSLYWIRWLNALLLGLVVVGSHLLLRGTHRDDRFLRLGVPAVLAFFPQDVFYGVTPDNLAMFSGAVAFVCVLRLATGRLDGGGRFALAGAAVSLAVLAKYTNAVYLVLALLASLLWARRTPPAWPVAARRLTAFWIAALLPIGLWLVRNLHVLGDAAGTRRKMELLEWAPKAWSGFFDHPFFTPTVAFGYLAELLARFWRGEFLWHGQDMSFAWLDALYGLSSVVLVGLAAWGVWRGRGTQPREPWTVELLALLAVLGAVAELVLLSLRIKFADWGTPTRDAPFFVHGRLILGVLLPFALLYVRGLQRACARLSGRARELTPWSLLGLWLLLVTACELASSAQAFQSPYNWYAEISSTVTIP
jgi:4-amino-4-deoxy-L-arabinose transferase-like glycosyltransferase